MNWEDRFEQKPVRTSISFGVVALLGLMVLAAVGGIGFTILNLMAQPGRVLQKTLDADNIIANYEWYFDANAQVSARVSQIAGHRSILAEATGDSEKNRLRIELAAIQQSCRDLTQRYNNNAMKLNDGLFRDWRLPKALDPSACELGAQS